MIQQVLQSSGKVGSKVDVGSTGSGVGAESESTGEGKATFIIWSSFHRSLLISAVDTLDPDTSALVEVPEAKSAGKSRHALADSIFNE